MDASRFTDATTAAAGGGTTPTPQKVAVLCADPATSPQRQKWRDRFVQVALPPPYGQMDADYID